MKVTEKSMEVLNYARDNGNRVSVEELANALGRTVRSVNANVTDLCKKELAVREKVAAKNENEKDITYIVLTDAGVNFVPATEADDE